MTAARILVTAAFVALPALGCRDGGLTGAGTACDQDHPCRRGYACLDLRCQVSEPAVERDASLALDDRREREAGNADVGAPEAVAQDPATWPVPSVERCQLLEPLKEPSTCAAAANAWTRVSPDLGWGLRLRQRPERAAGARVDSR